MQGLTERAFLVSQQAVFLDAQLRFESETASALLEKEGQQAVLQSQRPVALNEAEDEFNQGALF